MPESHQDSWTPFRVNPASKNVGWVCEPLDAVSHVTHIRHALSVIDDAQIRSRPVYDESRLNTTRIHVVWLSPNDWTNRGGSRYGNIEFKLEWKTLIRGLNSYWIGSMPSYNPTAVRILLTAKNRDDEFPRYDPNRGDGPWWYEASTDSHWWNATFCLEFMIERHLSLAEVAKMDFTDHSADMCNLRPLPCRDAGRLRSEAGPELLAGWACGALAGRSVPATTMAGFEAAWDRLVRILKRIETGTLGANDRTHTLAPTLARALLSAIAREDREELKLIALQFRTHTELYHALAAVVSKATGIPQADLTIPAEEGEIVAHWNGDLNETNE